MKTLKKILSLVLAVTLLLSIPVMAAAEDDEFFTINSVSIKALTGTWKDDYVGRIQVVINGIGRKLVTDGAFLTVGTNDSADNVCVVTLQNASVNFTGSKTIIEFDLNRRLDHGANYKFRIVEGSFATVKNVKNKEFVETVSGNVLIETLSVDYTEIPSNPIHKLIIYMETGKYAKLLYPVILILKFFVGL